MFHYVVRRILWMIPTLFGVAVVTFSLVKLAPGGVEAMKQAELVTGGGGRAGGDYESAFEKFRKRWLLDQPVWKQFAHYLGPFNLGENGHEWFGGTGEDPWHGILVLDMGNEMLRPNVKVADELVERLKVTVPLAAISVLLAYLVALPIGVFSAVRQGHALEVASTIFLFVLYSVPVFWAGLMLQFAFGRVGLDLLPIIGLRDPDAAAMAPGERFWDLVKHVILPIVTLSYASLAYLSRQMRVGVVDVMTQDYIRTARAKGLSEKVVVGKHMLRNSVIPILTLFASILPILIGGSIIVEKVFNLPGVGLYAYEGLVQREMNVIMAVTLLVAVMTMLGILLSDLLYAVVDPRIRYD